MAAGAALGSVIPGIGTLAGAGLGAGIGSLFGSSGGGTKIRWYPTMSEQQKSIYEQQLLPYLQSQIGRPLFQYGYGPYTEWGQRAYQAYRKPAMRAWNRQILPSIREQYAGASALYGGHRQRSEMEAGQMLAETLGAKRFEYERQALQDYISSLPQMNPALQYLMQAIQIPTFGIMGQPRAPSAAGQFGTSILSGMGQAFGERGGDLLGNMPTQWPWQSAAVSQGPVPSTTLWHWQ